MFATYCIFTAVFSWIFFGEKLNLKFAIGIGFMMSCVLCISAGAFIGNSKLTLREVMHTYWALGYGLLAPLLISISISVARYFTIYHGYSSLSYTIDNFTAIGIIELPFFIYFDYLRPYTFEEVVFGIGAGSFQILGTALMIYASTFGLAGPASAMVQCQALVQIILVSIQFGKIPSGLQIAGVGLAIIGAVIMSVDLGFLFKKRQNDTKLMS